jgi:glycosyltransferase involved in cell wall biosynthesis
MTLLDRRGPHSMPRKPTLRRARLYQTIRTAHLERAHVLEPATILFQQRRYDFEDSLAVGLELIQAGPLRSAWLLARSKVQALEINEPLMLESLPATAIALLALQWRRRRRTRPAVVTYAIGNLDPFAASTSRRLKSRVRRLLNRAMAKYVWAQVDRIVYGTDGARELYGQLLPPVAHMEELTIPALPEPCGCPPCHRHLSAPVVLFLGALADRKGFPAVLAAWPRIRLQHPTAQLRIVGKGDLEAVALQRAERDPSVQVWIDPGRDEVHRQLRAADVLVLPSRRTRTWREQVGLPIVEGLAHGCTIVTTTETGLASWLAEHGHTALPPECTAEELGTAVAQQLSSPRTAAEVMGSLPDGDGRLDADRWLFRDE